MRRFLYTFLILLGLTSCGNSITLSSNGKSDYKIVISESADSVTKQAASELQRYFAIISQATLPIVTDAEPVDEHEITVGLSNRVDTTGLNVKSLGKDGFVIRTDDNSVNVIGATSRANMNGVFSLLDDHFGCRKYSSKVEVIPSLTKVVMPKNVTDRQVPTMSYRDTHYKDTYDQVYVDWHKMSHDSHGGQPEWGFWCHSFDNLLPPSEHWDKHPEYFAMRGGKRMTTQPCLTNPAVLEIMCENLEKAMAKKPNATHWSVSSNDNFEYCQCPKCTHVDSIEGSATGSVIRFVNAVAERFPDKVISTLAYQYSRAAPKVTKPLKNVNIMFCSIECNRSAPIETDPDSESFRRDMEGWAKLTDNILVWDYVIQFKNLVSPFLNLHVLQPNLQYFAKNSVVAMFEQGNREIGGEFADLRAYLISKLMWNTNANVDSLITDFTNGYYGAGGVYVKQYIDAITANIVKSGDKLLIFGYPNDASKSYLSPENMAQYKAMFDKAEESVADQPDQLFRVRVARQPIVYAELEYARLEPFNPNGSFTKDANGKTVTNSKYIETLNYFTDICHQEGVVRLSEWHTSPDNYQYTMSQLAKFEDASLAHLKPVKISPQPYQRYTHEGGAVLTDGLHGCGDYRKQWLGWTSPQCEVVVDLETPTMVKKIATTYLQSMYDGILFPQKVTFMVSQDGQNYKTVGSVSEEFDQKNAVFTKEVSASVNQDVRYIKLVSVAREKNPIWHNSTAGNIFTHMDEIVVE